MIASSLAQPDPTTQTTATTQPVQRPKPPTTAPTTQPVQPSPSLQAGIPAPTTPPPLTTSDPLAFAQGGSTSPSQPFTPGAPAAPGSYTPPDTSSPTVPYVSAGGQTFVGGTQPTDAQGTVTGNGALGYGYVPGSNNKLIDLGGGMVAPTPGVDVSKGIQIVAPPNIPSDYSPLGMHIGDVTAAGKITGWNQLGGPIYDSSVTDPSKPDPFAHTWDGLQAADLSMQGFSSTPQATPASAGPAGIPTSPNGPASYGTAPFPASGPAAGAANDVTPNTGAGLSLPGGSSVAPGPANDATPSTGFQGTLGSILGGASSPAQGGAPGASSSFAPGVNLSPTTVDNALTNDTIAPGPMADRFKIAQDQWQNFVNATDPQYQAALRDAQSRAFGAGRGVSGALRTSLGDLANQRSLALDTQKNSFLNNALSGSIEDAYRNLGIAQQQQAFQAGQQGTAFNQALQQLMAGSQGDPSQIALMLSGIFGSQGNGISNALGNYAMQTTANNNSQTPSWLYPYLYGASTAQTDPILNQGIPGVQTTPGGGY